MSILSRRDFLQRTVTGSLALGAGLAGSFCRAASEATQRKMTIDLVCALLGFPQTRERLSTWPLAMDSNRSEWTAGFSPA